jgi:bifunctional non-homologous end joining protein LigD
MSLIDYIKKRNFSKTSEPSGDAHVKPKKSQSMFVIQKHDASHLHYDFRLEVDGVLKSWAVPKGPSLDVKQKRLAMMVEDHPYSYGNFEGEIPKGSYGAGEVIVWDTGTYTVKDFHDKKNREQYMLDGIEKGEIKFELQGQKLNGHFALVKMRTAEGNSWLLIKEHDEFEVEGEDNFSDVSVLSDRVLTRDGGEGWKDTDEKSDKKTSSKKPTSSIRKSSKLPEFFKPMLATLVDEPFTDPEWIFEPKLDGYRTLAFIDKSGVQLYSRNHISLNKKFYSIAKVLEQLPLQAVIDGEVVGMNEDGKIDFQALQNADRNPDQLIYHVFDLTFLQGNDITHIPLIERKKLLKKAVENLKQVKYVEHVKDGKKLFEHAKKSGTEGIIAKKADSFYRTDSRSEDWLKIKITHEQEVIICGYTEPQGSRHHFGSLLLGVYQDNILHYIGHTGTGFDEKTLEGLKTKLDKLKTDQLPFNHIPEVHKNGVTWIKPELVCEVKFASWTDDNQMRHAVFLGLREDKDAKEVIVETPESVESAMKEQQTHSLAVKLSHPEKIYWPKHRLTKRDLLEYYEQVGPLILPYLKDRPESLNRMPNGIEEPGFFQKDITFDVPEFVDLVKVKHEETGETQYLVCNNLQTLLYMANLGCIEINPWNSRVGSLDYPDYLLIDLDPVEIEFSKVVEVAQAVKKILDKAHIKAFIKTSGKRGMHIYIPLGAKYETDISTDFARLIATLAHKEAPDISSIERLPKDRQHRVYIDFLQNRRGQTLAAPYSVRPTAEATVSTPIEWDELKSSLNPKAFTLKTMPKRIKKVGDLWKGMLKEKNDLKKALKYLST